MRAGAVGERELWLLDRHVWLGEVRCHPLHAQSLSTAKNACSLLYYA